MRIAVLGTGGVGGYFGAKLAQAGHDVAFVARGKHLAAMRERGLRVRSANGEVHLPHPTVTDDPASIGPVDTVMFCVKLWDVEGAAPLVAPLVARGGVAIPFQNGVDSPSILSRVLGPASVVGGVAYIAAVIAEPGVIAHTGTMARLRVGELPGGPRERAAAFVEACKGAGVEAEHAPDIRVALWEKFVFLCALSGCTSLARKPLGVIRSDPDLRATFEAAMLEVMAVARAQGVALPDALLDQLIRQRDSLPAEMRSSMLNDLVAGNRLEAPWLAGAIVRMAHEHGVPVPVNATIYAALKPYIDGTPRT